MTYLHYIFSPPVQQPSAYSPKEAKSYFQEKNISWNTTYNVAKLVATAFVLGPLEAANDKSAAAVTTAFEHLGNAVSSLNDTMAKQVASAGTKLLNFGSWAVQNVQGMLWSSAGDEHPDLPEAGHDDGTYLLVEPVQELTGPSYDFAPEDGAADWLLVGLMGGGCDMTVY